MSSAAKRLGQKRDSKCSAKLKPRGDNAGSLDQQADLVATRSHVS